MSAVIISYKLKPGVTPADFEHWVKTVDQPTLRGMARVKAFDTFRVERLLMGEGEPSAHYVLVSTREHGNNEGPVEFRSYRIVNGEVTEEDVAVVPELPPAEPR